MIIRHCQRLLDAKISQSVAQTIRVFGMQQGMFGMGLNLDGTQGGGAKWLQSKSTTSRLCELISTMTVPAQYHPY